MGLRLCPGSSLTLPRLYLDLSEKDLRPFAPSPQSTPVDGFALSP